MESSAAEEVESVPSSETVEAVLALEVPLGALCARIGYKRMLVGVTV